MGERRARSDNMKYEEITYPLGESPWTRYLAVGTLTAEDIYKLLREGIQKYENEYGFSPSKIMIDSRAFNILKAEIGKVMKQTGSLEFYGIPCEVKSLPDDQVAIIMR